MYHIGIFFYRIPERNDWKRIEIKRLYKLLRYLQSDGGGKWAAASNKKVSFLKKIKNG